MPEELNRRTLLKFGAAAVAATSIGSAQAPHRFFTPEEFALVDEVTDLIIPTDAKSPGARAAKVADFIDGRLADAFESETRDKFRAGLKLIDALSEKLNQTAFLQLTPEKRVATLLQLAGDERHPKSPEEQFFRELKDFTCRGYYSSKIGIHTDQDYKGNVVQGGEYAGILPDGPALAPSK